MKAKPIVTVEVAKPPLSLNVEFYLTVEDRLVRRAVEPSSRRAVEPMVFVGRKIDDDGAYRRPSFSLKTETAEAFLKAMAKLAYDMGIGPAGATTQLTPRWPTDRETKTREPYGSLTQEEMQELSKGLHGTCGYLESYEE